MRRKKAVIVSLGQQNFDCRSYCGLSHRVRVSRSIFTWNVIACFFLWKWRCVLHFSWCVKRPITYTWNYFQKRYRRPSILYGIILLKLKLGNIPGEQSAMAKQQWVKRHSKVLKMVIAIVSGFLFCWGLVTVLTFLTVFLWENTTTLPCGVLNYSFVTKVMAHANCAINLFITYYVWISVW